MAPHANRAGPAGPDGLDRLLAERGDHLLRAAIALTGSRRLLRNWRRVEDPEGYLRRALYNLAADGWRRTGAWRRKVPLLNSLPDGGAGADPVTTVDLRDALVRALRQLPARQRTVLVLHYWEQLTHTETAELLGWPEGTVRSAASRGLSRLRELTAPWHDPEPHLTKRTP